MDRALAILGRAHTATPEELAGLEREIAALGEELRLRFGERILLLHQAVTKEGSS